MNSIAYYKSRLRDLVCTQTNAGIMYEKYSLLFDRLFETEFLWHIKNDDNRLTEAKNMRDDILTEGLDCGYFEEINCNLCQKPVSLLEVIIRICYVCSQTTPNVGKWRDVKWWFTLLMRNADYDDYDDEHFDAEEVDEISHRIMRRTYSWSGFGGLFPLVDAKKDQRKVELWYQMNSFILEN
jgi:hypothetical protein